MWNEDYHDIVLATFNNRTIPFRVRAYGTSVTVAPTSIDGDANWEAAQQYMFVAMDLALARKIRSDEIYVDDLVVQNVLARDKTGKAMCQIDGENGGIGFLAGGNIRWDANGNVFQDASIFRKLKLLESKSDSYEYYLDFNTGLNLKYPGYTHFQRKRKQYTCRMRQTMKVESACCIMEESIPVLQHLQA